MKIVLSWLYVIKYGTENGKTRLSLASEPWFSNEVEEYFMEKVVGFDTSQEFRDHTYIYFPLTLL